MTTRRAKNKYSTAHDSVNNLYDTSYNEQQYSILYMPSSAHKAPIRLNELTNFVIERPEQICDIADIDPPDFIEFDDPVDHYTGTVDLNDILWEVFMGDGDTIALSLNMLRIYKTYKDGYGKIDKYGLYSYSEEKIEQEVDPEMASAMRIFGTIGKALFKEQYLSSKNLKNTQLRVINAWKGRNLSGIHFNWALHDILERSHVIVRMSSVIVKKYIAENLYDLFTWLLQPERSFGGQITHIANLLGIYYITRFGAPSKAYSNKLGGGITYTLPNTKVLSSNIHGYKNNTIGRAWACGELYLALIRNYDPGHNIASYFLLDETYTEDAPSTFPVDQGGDGHKVGTLRRSNTLKNRRHGLPRKEIPDMRVKLRDETSGRIVFRRKDGNIVSYDETLDIEGIKALAKEFDESPDEDASDEFTSRRRRPLPTLPRSDIPDDHYEEPFSKEK